MSADSTPEPTTLARTHRVWASIGWRSFGGPSAQIALMHRVLVEEQRWLTEDEFMHALGFCMLLPGPEAMQLATYAGWKRHGVAGGLVAGLWFVLPGALVVGTLAAVYARFGELPWMMAAFSGVQATVLVLVIEAMQRIAKRALKGSRSVLIALGSLAALGLLGVPYPLVVLAAGLVGALGERAAAEPSSDPRPRGDIGGTVRTVLLWLAIWTIPLFAIARAFGPQHILTQLGVFFSKLAVVTFGGAYAVLGYMSQDVVARHGWLTAHQMLDGLGLAETTPGPLILVTEFVGFVAAYRAHPERAFGMGLLGALVALWATFAPCFLWIFAGAPWLEALRQQPRLRGALAGITAAVLGVMLSLALWFALHVWFGATTTFERGPWHMTLPVLVSLSPRLVGLTLLSGLLLWRARWSAPRTLALTALVALVIEWAGTPR